MGARQANTRPIQGSMSIEIYNPSVSVGERVQGVVQINLSEPVANPELSLILKCKELIEFRKGCKLKTGNYTRSKSKYLLHTWDTSALTQGSHSFEFDYEIPLGIHPIFSTNIFKTGTVSISYFLGGRLEGVSKVLKTKKPIKVFNDGYIANNSIVPPTKSTVVQSISKGCGCFGKREGNILFAISKSVYKAHESIDIEIGFDITEFKLGIRNLTLSFYRDLVVDANINKKRYEEFYLLKREMKVLNIPEGSKFVKERYSYSIKQFLNDLEFSVNTKLIQCQFMLGLEVKLKRKLTRSAKIPKMSLWFAVEAENPEKVYF